MSHREGQPGESGPHITAGIVGRYGHIHHAMPPTRSVFFSGPRPFFIRRLEGLHALLYADACRSHLRIT